jgi:membrane-associated protease RseP (regulator of RpoE activity)
MLVTRVREESPLAKAGIVEGDVLLRINDTNVRFEQDLQRVVDRAGATPLSIELFRDGEITEKSVTPGVERYQKIHHMIFALGLSTHFEIDLLPTPDFSLVALGFDSKGKRLDLRDAAAKYRIARGEYYRDDKDGWQGLSSAEGWKAWLGPLAVSENKLIISQERPQ